MQIKEKSQLKQKILRYIKNKLGVNHTKVGDMPICPYIQQYKNAITVVESDDPEQIVKNFIVFRDIFKLEAVVVYGFDWEYDDLADELDYLNKKYRRKDIECLGMHPDTEQTPLPVEYTFRDTPLIIIQRRSTLLKARKELAKTTKYYKYFKEPAK